MTQTKKLILIAIASTILIGSLIAGGFYWAYQSYLDTPLLVGEKGKSFEVKPGMSLRKIARELKKAGIMKKPHYFIWHAKFSKGARNIHVGEYFIKKDTTPRKLFTMLTTGEVVNYSITIIEGWTFKQMMAAIEKHPAIKHTLTGLSQAQIMSQLGLAGVHLWSRRPGARHRRSQRQGAAGYRGPVSAHDPG